MLVRGTGNPIQCSEKTLFAVSDWMNDFSHMQKRKFTTWLYSEYFSVYIININTI